jgi:TPR repeat protein
MAGLINRVSGWVASPAGKLRAARKLIAANKRAEAFPLLAQAAQAGVVDAEFEVARAYLEGAGVPPSAGEGARWLERAAQKDHTEAQSLLAALYIRGIPSLAGNFAGAATAQLATTRPAAVLFAGVDGATPDFAQALSWARRAANVGSADGQALLAFIYTSGPDELRDLPQAEELYRQSAEADCPQGCLGYALALMKKAAGPEEYGPAAVLMQRAADAGLATAQYLAGVLAENGHGVLQDLARAAEYYRLAALHGLRSAQARYGVVLMQGRGVPADAAEGETWLRRAALQGDPDAAAMVGDLYARGGELPPNLAEAAMWYRRAAEAGHTGASRALGLLYLSGAGVPRDPVEAAHWFRIAAEAGVEQAKHDLAALVMKGQAQTEDSVRTREWFQLAAEGVVNAQYWYGKMLMDGRGLLPDPAEGQVWIARAAGAGMVDAQVALAEILVSGRGGRTDHAEALILFETAAGTGHVGAMFAVGALLGGGHDVPWDRPRAQYWFRRAAEHGHGIAQQMLGRYLARGLAGEVDIEQARMWFERAEAQGVADIAADLASLPPATPSPVAPGVQTGAAAH